MFGAKLCRPQLCPHSLVAVSVSPAPVVVTMGNSGSIAEVVSHLETPLADVKNKSILKNRPGKEYDLCMKY